MKSVKQSAKATDNIKTTETTNTAKTTPNTEAQVIKGMTPPVLELIDAETAQKYLDTNPHNRPIHQGTINGYVKEMEDDEFKLTHQGIAFDVHGHLQDGQHRLLAVIQSGKPQQFWVFRNMPEENFTKIDVGRDRKPSDVLALEGIDSPNLTSSISKFILAYESGSKANAIAASTGSSGKNYISNDKILHFAKDNKKRLEKVAELSKTWFDKFPKALEMRFIGGLYWYISAIDEERANEFFEHLSSGADLPEDSPILKLRNILMHNLVAKKKLPRSEKFALAVKAWNLYIQEKKVGKLSFNKKAGEKFPEIMRPQVEEAA
jgi:hypothetical protein